MNDFTRAANVVGRLARLARQQFTEEVRYVDPNAPEIELLEQWADSLEEARSERRQLEPTRWVVVVAPRGDVIRLHIRFSEYADAGTLFGMSLHGRFDDGKPVTVRGTHVSLAWREPLSHGPQS